MLGTSRSSIRLPHSAERCPYRRLHARYHLDVGLALGEGFKSVPRGDRPAEDARIDAFVVPTGFEPVSPP
jgi:hypothetical protein